MQYLKGKPYFLSDADIDWVVKTRDAMTPEEKIGQLFCTVGYTADETALVRMAKDLAVGGMMCRPMPGREVVETVSLLQKNAKVPLLIAANLEAGGNGGAVDGTRIGCEMMVAATGNVETASRLGTVCGREGAAVGINWAFAPVIDIDYNFRNPITNTRTFGSDPERVKQMGAAYVTAVQAQGVAASIKHFPGDGVDERDQHLVTSVNSLSVEEWDATFGKAYESSIEAGAMTVMVGHIAQPAYSKLLNPALKDEEILPATLSRELVTGLLRGKLGFNGLIVTDASTMAGMTIPMHRAKAVPAAIAAGCDMFLFTRNLEEDFRYMKQGVEDGTISPERLTDALTRILGIKAALGLHHKNNVPDIDKVGEILSCAEHVQWAKECTDDAITLVKEEKGVLPLSPAKTKRVMLYPIEANLSGAFAYGPAAGVPDKVRKRFEQEGFAVTVFTPPTGMEGMMASYEDFLSRYDLIVYVANLATRSNQTTVRIEWASPMGANVPVYINEIPTLFISLENPYHLLDAPRVKTYINTYGSSDVVLDVLMDKLTGRSAFKGKSPVDAFCGKWDTRL